MVINIFGSNFYKFIIGAKGATLKRLASDTKTQIKIPKLGQDGDVGEYQFDTCVRNQYCTFTF